MKILRNFVEARFVEPQSELQTLVNPTTEAAIAQASSHGVDFAHALAFARREGGAALRRMSLAERGQLLMAMSKTLHAARENLLDLATENGGNTRADGKFDVDGASGTLAAYAKLAESFGSARYLADGPSEPLGKSPRYVGKHLWVPRQGVAVLINAFNFPAWGFAEKAATALLAGMPVLCKPATSTALVTARIAELLAESNLVPPGVVSFVFGGAGDLLAHLEWQDVIAFTGSSATGALIRSHANVIGKNLPVSIEADSLNAAVLGPDVDPSSPAYDLFLREVVRDMTQKAGQKCTAIRRIFVPATVLAQVRSDLAEQLKTIRTGDPAQKEVTVGPLATAAQRAAIQAELGRLREVTKAVVGDGGRGALVGVSGDQGYFVTPTLLEAADAERAAPVHSREVFGPCATLMPYDGKAASAARLLALGGGSLVSSVYSDDADFALGVVELGGAALGRLHLGSSKIAEHSPGPGTVLPSMAHGGPGRAGGGQELGGVRGAAFYSQRLAVQGFQPWLEKLA